MPRSLIYDPRFSPSAPRVPISVPIEAASSPIRFPRALNRGMKKTTTLDAVETKGIWILPGTNIDVPDEDYEYISRHPVGSEMLARGALKVILPSIEEGKVATETTRDYSEPDALELIRNSSDLDWLERSERKEDRPTVYKVLVEQIKSIKSLNAKG